MADVAVLKNGQQIKGAIANREHLAKDPWRYEFVSIVPDSSMNLMRIDISEIDYVLLMDGESRRIIDFTQHNTMKINMIQKQRKTLSNKNNGIGLMIFGAAAGLTGTLIKFGGPKTTISDSEIDLDDKSYNAGNYLLMGIGGFAFISGLVLVNIPDKAENHAYLELEKDIKKIGINLTF